MGDCFTENPHGSLAPTAASAPTPPAPKPEEAE
jgi:hypothetical protein